jgi:hypothetical protein
MSTALFRITEYEQVGLNGLLFTPQGVLTLRLKYHSGLFGLRDASRFAAALSYARGTYVSVVPAEPDREKYHEWWYAGALWNSASVPPILSERATAPWQSPV